MGILATKAIIKTELAEMKTASEGKSDKELEAQAQKELDLLKNTILNFAITGVTGAGKSSLVNALRDVGDDEEGAAKIGVTETTLKPEAFTHPKLPNVKIWDLPGTGTLKFKPEKYLQDVNFRQYDFFIIVARDRFTIHDINLALEIQKMKKQFYFVRTQIDNSLRSEERKRDFNEKATLEKIRNYCCENLKEVGMSSPRVFLISSWHPEKYDFPLLLDALTNELNDVKKEILIMAMPTYSEKALENKKAVVRSLIWKFALVSGAYGAIPTPGLSFACDVAILVGAMKRFCSIFGLDEDSLQNLAVRIGQPVSELKSVIKYTPKAGEIKMEFVIDRLLRSAFCATSTMLESVLDFVPVVGSLTGAGLSFITTYYQLKSFLDDIVKDAENVRAKVAELSQKNPK